MLRPARSLAHMAGVLVVLTALALPGRAQNESGPQPDQPATRPSAPQVGQRAPTFELKTLDGKSSVDIAGYRGNKPVVLIFGSYT